jgi:hypothetical protein
MRIPPWILSVGEKRWLSDDGISLLFIEVVPDLHWTLQFLLKLLYLNAPST